MQAETLLFFGTFNPPTLGHLFVITQVLQLFPDSQLWIIPADTPIWEKKGVVVFSHRMGLLALLCKQLPNDLQPRVSVNPVEHEKQLSGKTIETLEYLQRLHPQKKFRIVMGADSFTTFDRWYQWESILQAVPVSVIPRGTLFLPQDIRTACSRALQVYIETRVSIHPIQDQDERWFSSTQTKADLQVLGESIELPSTLLSYIRTHLLYDGT